ncbi:Glyoxylase, beta-lactamase superfamily II [Saccharopolyspora antimicrobica]|uniref:Glyoxylase, beta-lactamase superfamily II n=1 Tax=Saccharopolyspora antimicrobica TaxID=455193 RepID=A0A1I4YE89_9PSEU|nr:MBL fold metallo-hydrolase [Saccharopolyspora antimicrobica]RKT82634.1 glyoxylase-like metal-dependent hydrolase (beta-lactamase superfamily II) [Saccharopolyspora antimicrobica]SFN36296.1 Glyoxylase, beta-lactamase superfamily II [Saccharopolyspora antimicrobica]
MEAADVQDGQANSSGTPAATPLPVARQWFTATRIDQAITLITEPHVHPFLRSNTWHVRGRGRDLLIDTGLGVQSLRASLPGLVSTDREPVVVLTHAHPDHMGSAHEFTEVWAHEAEPAAAAGRGSLMTGNLATRIGMSEALVAALPPVLIDAIPEPGYQVENYELRPARVTRTLAEADEIDLGDRVLRVLHLPGHSPGSIALLDEENGTLFSGDVIYDELLLDDLHGSDPTAYRATMNRLRTLELKVVHAGHEPSFSRTRLHELANTYLNTR